MLFITTNYHIEGDKAVPLPLPQWIERCKRETALAHRNSDGNTSYLVDLFRVAYQVYLKTMIKIKPGYIITTLSEAFGQRDDRPTELHKLVHYIFKDMERFVFS